MYLTSIEELFKINLLTGNIDECLNIIENNMIDINKSDENNNSLFMLACYYGYRKVITKIMNKYDLKLETYIQQNSEGKNSLMLICENMLEYIIIRIIDIFKNNNIINIVDNNGNSLIFYTCNYRLYCLSFTLLTLNIDLCIQNNDDDTPFTCSLKNGLCEISKYMLKNITSDDNNFLKILTNNYSPLMIAIEYQELNIALFLIKNYTADQILLDFYNNNGWTALMIACDYAFIDVSMEILKKCKFDGINYASLEMQNNEGMTALMFACKLRDDSLALEILTFDESISNLYVYNNEGDNAMTIAKNNNNINIFNKVNELMGYFNQNLQNPITNLNSNVSINIAILLINNQIKKETYNESNIAIDPTQIEDDMTIKEYFLKTNDNIIFKVNNTYFMCKRSLLKYIKDKAIYYEDQFNLENPLYYMNKVGINIGFVYYEQIYKIIHEDCKKQFFNIINKPIKTINSIIYNNDIIDNNIKYIKDENNIYIIEL